MATVQGKASAVLPTGNPTEEPKERSISEILIDARGVIETQGWTTGLLVDPHTHEVCLLGGIAVTQGYLDVESVNQYYGDDAINNAYVQLENDPAVQFLADLIAAGGDQDDFDNLIYNGNMDDVYRWNDRGFRTKEEVLDLLIEAAQKYEAENAG